MPLSYEYIRESFLGPDCVEIFCRQMTDQLVFCKECGEIPMLLHILKDQDRMEIHLKQHKHDSFEHAILYQFLRRTFEDDPQLQRSR